MADFGKINPVRRRSQAHHDGHSRVSMNKLKIMITVVGRAKADFYMDHIQSFGVNMQMVVFGQGTAPLEIATAMGLVDSERAVIISVIGEDRLPAALESLEEKFNTIVGGKGIAYTIPMASIIGKSIFNFLSDNRNAVLRSAK
ncbi:MAG: hypothetical protein MJZ26_04645 [Fibrobacter sp.]|nr:hypothetical protein [Fibrobacter sp.]